MEAKIQIIEEQVDKLKLDINNDKNANEKNVNSNNENNEEDDPNEEEEI